MTNEEYDILMQNVILPAVKHTRQSGGEEYARSEDNIFANFERVSESLDISVEECIMVYSLKHIDGITAHVQGTTSQREDVRGRITDLIVYMSLLWAYLVKDESNEEPEKEADEKVKLDFNENIKMTDKVQENLNRATYYKEGDTDMTDAPIWDGDLENMPDNLKVTKIRNKKASQQPINSDGSPRGCCGGNKATQIIRPKPELEKAKEEHREMVKMGKKEEKK
tara:strand:+ start:6187 stop:6858 length:672 start_codon:yes stop_codon:yes gene_type:complete